MMVWTCRILPRKPRIRIATSSIAFAPTCREEARPCLCQASVAGKLKRKRKAAVWGVGVEPAPDPHSIAVAVYADNPDDRSGLRRLLHGARQEQDGAFFA
jgi:hypothetical protein